MQAVNQMHVDQVTPKQLKKALLFALPYHFPLLIKGMPGTGKTDIILQACQELKFNVIISHPVVSDPTDLKGLPYAFFDDKKGRQRAAFLPFGELEELLEATEETVYFLDDLGQAPASVQAAAMQLILARRINGFKVSDKVTFLAATNRREDKAGVTGILEPVKSRFFSILELIPDALEWAEWAAKAGQPTPLVYFNRYKPDLMKSWTPTNDMKNGPNPRTISHIGEMQNKGIPKELELPFFAGSAGEGYATEYLAFLKIYRTLPNPDLVIMNPAKAEIPTDPATLYALCSAIAARANDSNFARIIEYCNRLAKEEHGNPPIKHGEFSMMVINDILAQKPQLATTTAYLNWSIENQDLVNY